MSKEKKIYNRNVHEPYERAMLKWFNKTKNFLLQRINEDHNCKTGEITLRTRERRRLRKCKEVESNLKK